MYLKPRHCVDCKHYMFKNKHHLCFRSEVQFNDLVTGDRFGPTCKKERSEKSEGCGPRGTFYVNRFNSNG